MVTFSLPKVVKRRGVSSRPNRLRSERKQLLINELETAAWRGLSPAPSIPATTPGSQGIFLFVPFQGAPYRPFAGQAQETDHYDHRHNPGACGSGNCGLRYRYSAPNYWGRHYCLRPAEAEVS